MKKLVFLLSFPFLILACANDDSHKSFSKTIEFLAKPEMAPNIDKDMIAEAEPTSFDQSSSILNTKNSKNNRKILRTVNTRFQTEDLDATTTYLEQLTKEFNGYVTNMNHTHLNNRMQVSIPSENLDAFMEGLKSRSINTDYTRINGEDVTEEFHDISTRLKTKKEVQRRYKEILRNRAQTIDEILSAEEKIRIVQEEIEAIQGRLRFINTRETMSQVHIDVYEIIPPVKKPEPYVATFFSKIKSSFMNGWEWIQGLIIGVVGIWPMWFVLGCLLYFRKSLVEVFRKQV